MKNSSQNPYPRILVNQPYGIGDTLFMLPFLKALKEQNQSPKIDIILGSRSKQLLESSPYIDEIFVIDKDLWKKEGKIKTFFSKMSLLKEFKKRKYALFVDVSMQPEYAFWARFFLRIPTSIGFDYKRRNKFLNQSLNIPLEGFSEKHVVEYYNDLAKILGIPIIDKRPELTVPEEILNKARALLDHQKSRETNFIVISPGGGETWGRDANFKHWPIAYFLQLTKRLKDKLRFEEVVVLGIDNERHLGDYLKNNLELKVLNLCGKTGLMEAAAIIKLSSLFLGNDGGLVHLAATQHVPIIALYGPTDPNLYGAYPDKSSIAKLSKNLVCQPCYKKFRYNKECKDRACLKDLLPQEVFDELDRRSFFNNFVLKTP